MPLMFDDLPAPEKKPLRFDDLPPSVGVGEDVAKSVGVAPLKGVIGGLGTSGDIRQAIGSGLDYLGNKVGVSGVGPAYEAVAKHIPFAFQQGPTSQQLRGAVEEVTGPIYNPQTAPGRYAAAPVEALSNPVSYLGPGGLALKASTAALSGLGSQAGEDIAGTPGRIAGGLAGGAAAVKAMGARAAEAAIPTLQELNKAARTGGQYGGYTGALMSGLELDPAQVAPVAYGIEQRLNARGFTGGKNGTAPGTLSDIQGLQSPPANSTITAANLDTLRATLGQRASEMATDARGFARPTPDAVAAQQALRDLKSYTENIPQSHVLAGDAQAYNNAIQEANANYAAYARTKGIDARLGKAENMASRLISTTQGQQIQNKLAPLLDRPDALRGLSQEEVAQLQRINDGTIFSNTAKQLGRGATGVIPLGLHLTTALTTGGASIPYQLALESVLGPARYLGSRSTVKAANKLDEMLRQRSPEFEQRKAALPQPDMTPNKAALARALLTSIH